jgi:cobalamin biosynthesis protein CbiG
VNTTDIVIITYSDYGRHVAKTLKDQYVDASVMIKPLPFADTVRTNFQNGKRLILIVPTGIAIRCLGDLITDDINDPMILVIDESADYVLPLFADFDGDTVLWATEVAKRLNAQLIKTHNNRKQQTIYTMAVSCREDTSTMTLQNLLLETLKKISLTASDIKQLACKLDNSEYPAIKKLARNLNLPLHGFSDVQLQQVKSFHPELDNTVLAALAAAHQLTQKDSVIIATLNSDDAECCIAKTVFSE